MVTTPWSGISPPQTVSAPDHVDWHLIQDHELTALSKVATGVVQSLGFTGLGGAIGLAGAFISALEKVTATKPLPLSGPDLYALLAFSSMIATAAICLTLSGLSYSRNKGTVAEIRQRRKTGMPD